MANMPGFTYPFPTKDLAYQELTYDYCYNKIKEEDKERIVDRAWKKGEETAKEIFAKFNGSYDFRKICTESGLHLNDKDTDYVVGNQRYFSDYVSGTNQINLYLKSIEKWAEENQLSMDDAWICPSILSTSDSANIISRIQSCFCYIVIRIGDYYTEYRY